VTGSPTAYILGQAGQQATSDVTKWWLDREQNSFDAIYVSAGHPVVINFTQDIPIDYNPQGRKLRHVLPTHTQLTIDGD